MIRILAKRNTAEVLLACICLLTGFSGAQAAPEFAAVKSGYRSSEQVFLDRRGRPLQERRIDNDVRRLRWTSLAEISPALTRAVLRSEDKRFYDHSGADWLAVGSAAWNFVTGGPRRGASTISMQVAGILDESLSAPGGGRTVDQKLRQIRAARQLEEAWSKEEILEAYFNLISFRGELQGIQSASQGLFGKSPEGLTDVESVILAALIRSPQSTPALVQRRACLLAHVLRLAVDCSTTNPIVHQVLTTAPRIRPLAGLAPHLPELMETAEREVHTTLDLDLQRAARETLYKHLISVRNRNVRDGAIVIVENSTGEILAYVGSSGELSSAPLVDFARSRRQAGSTLKTFIYGQALERRYLTASSEILDTPLNRSVGTGIYRPENYDGHFLGPIPLRIALASSRNIPAVRALEITGVDQAVERLELLGFKGLRESQFYGPSLALGSADVTLVELVGAYRALANGGVWSPLRTAAGQSLPSHRAFSEGTAFILGDILSDRESRSPSFGLESVLSTQFWTAVKTGTSKDMRDNWCIGYSDRYTAGVWVGNASGEPMWNVLGITGAAPVWLELMNRLHAGSPSQPPRPPASLVKARSALGEEYYLAGTEPVGAAPPAAQQPLEILYPDRGSIFALDPDIPRDRQKIFFRWRGGAAGQKLSWSLNGRLIGQQNPAAWTPVRGKFVLKLERSCGVRCTQVVAEAPFEVR